MPSATSAKASNVVEVGTIVVSHELCGRGFYITTPPSGSAWLM
jgi:hypothetical protein